jgi:hypothetical protein
VCPCCMGVSLPAPSCTQTHARTHTQHRCPIGCASGRKNGVCPRWRSGGRCRRRASRGRALRPCTCVWVWVFVCLCVSVYRGCLGRRVSSPHTVAFVNQGLCGPPALVCATGPWPCPRSLGGGRWRSSSPSTPPSRTPTRSTRCVRACVRACVLFVSGSVSVCLCLPCAFECLCVTACTFIPTTCSKAYISTPPPSKIQHSSRCWA